MLRNNSILELQANLNNFFLPDVRDKDCPYSGNEMREGLKELEMFLMLNQRMQRIGLAECRINDELAKHIGIGLFQNKALCSLNLSKNLMTDKGARTLI